MIPAENVRDWRGHAVVDQNGDKIGTLEAVYVDTATDEPSFLSVEVGGLIGRHRLVFVPLGGAVVGPGWLKVPQEKKHVRGAPAIEPDGELLAQAEPDVFAHYGLGYQPGVGGERRLARR
jgi:hypothetical protein